MRTVKKMFYDAWLWIIRWFRIEKKALMQLRGMRGEDVKTGHMYEYYGRIFVAEKNEDPVDITFIIETTPEISPVAASIIVDNIELLNTNGNGGYTTKYGHLADVLRGYRGVNVSDAIANTPCHKCDILKHNLPCPACDFCHTYRLLRTKRQHATDQEQWLRTQRRKLGLE